MARLASRPAGADPGRSDSCGPEPEYGFSQAHALAVLGLVGGMLALLIWVGNAEPPAPAAAPVAVVDADSTPAHQRPTADQSGMESEQVRAAGTLGRMVPADAVASSAAPGTSSPDHPAVAEASRDRRSMSEAAASRPVVALAEKPPAVAAGPIPAARRGPPEWGEAALLAQLDEAAVTVGLDKEQATDLINTLRASDASRSSSGLDFLEEPDESESKPAVMTMTPELLAQIGTEGLPFQMGQDCRLDAAAARALESRSRILQRAISQMDRIRQTNHSYSHSIWMNYEQRLIDVIKQSADWKTAAAVPAMAQVLQVEGYAVRQQLVSSLAAIDDEAATRALVARALFDLSEDVRQSASQALAARSVGRSGAVNDEIRGPLLEGFRYPWAPVAWHAADALVALDDQKAVDDLIDLLDAPDPARPHRDEAGRLVVRELVRVNHMRNCLLCHAQSTRTTDRVAAVVPTPGRPLRLVYYGDSRRRSSDIFVRADVTYLRQDFSVMHELPDQKPWPASQRFDYMLRTRLVDPADVPAVAERSSTAEPGTEPGYAQRDAVLYALRKLTGQDGGTTSDGWRRLMTDRPMRGHHKNRSQ